MATALLVRDFFIWMYFDAPVAYTRIWGNILWFLYHFFSIKLLTLTLFSKWKQLGEVRKERGFDEWMAVFAVNTLMHIVGFFIRSFTIIVGLGSIALAVMLGGAFFVLWFLLPLVIISAFVLGVALLII